MGRPLALLVTAALVVAACGSDSSTSTETAATVSGNSPRVVKIRISDSGCDPVALQIPAGPTTFEVTRTDNGNVTEAEILQGTQVLGEVENIKNGGMKSFSLSLQPGNYTLVCPGANGPSRGPIQVTGNAVAPPKSPEHFAAVQLYRSFLEDQTAQLVAQTDEFVRAVKAGNVAEAKKLYGPARVPYEQIEPVAESFGSLDPKIDAREGDVPRSEWTGFHPLEKALWVDKTTAGQEPNADGLARDVRDLQTKVKTVKLQPAQIANGAVELLGEVSKSKITGEEERYSHIDLVDFAANVAGAQAAFNAVLAIAKKRDAALTAQIQRRFAAVTTALLDYRTDDGGFVSYEKLSRSDIRRLSQAIDALAEPLSRVPALVVR